MFSLIGSVNFYMMVNNLQLEDLGITEAEFTLEKKCKFIQNCASKFTEGSNVIKQMFVTMKALAFPLFSSPEESERFEGEYVPAPGLRLPRGLHSVRAGGWDQFPLPRAIIPRI